MSAHTLSQMRFYIYIKLYISYILYVKLNI